MTWDEHCLLVGKIIVNLQSLEFILRRFLSEEAGENAQLPQPGDITVPENRLTNYKSLGQLVGDYNAKLEDTEAPRFVVDQAVVTVRHALVHGRLLSRKPSPPVTLFKFGKPEKGKAPVELVNELTPEWLSAKIALTRDQTTKVKDCAEVRGHEWLG